MKLKTFDSNLNCTNTIDSAKYHKSVNGGQITLQIMNSYLDDGIEKEEWCALCISIDCQKIYAKTRKYS